MMNCDEGIDHWMTKNAEVQTFQIRKCLLDKFQKLIVHGADIQGSLRLLTVGNEQVRIPVSNLRFKKVNVDILQFTIN